MNTHDNSEPTDRVNYERTTPNPYLENFTLGESRLPPPPPPIAKSGRFKKIVVPLLVVISILLASTFAYIIGFESGTATHSQNSNIYRPISIDASSTATLQHTPTLSPAQAKAQSTNNGLYAQDFNSFYGTFTQDMTSGKYSDLGASVSSSFELSCDNTTSPPCAYGWINVYHMLTGGHLTFSFPYDATYTNDSCKNIPYPVRAYTYTVVHYDQDGSLKAPTVGDAVLIFSNDYIGENTSQWFWEGVILQSAC